MKNNAGNGMRNGDKWKQVGEMEGYGQIRDLKTWLKVEVASWKQNKILRENKQKKEVGNGSCFWNPPKFDLQCLLFKLDIIHGEIAYIGEI